MVGRIDSSILRINIYDTLLTGWIRKGNHLFFEC